LKGRYKEDMVVIFSMVAVILLAFALVDAGGSPPTWFHDTYFPPPPPEPSPPSRRVEVSLLDEQGHTAEDASSEVALEVVWTDVIEVRAVLAWVDDIGSNDEFELTLLYQGEELDSVSGTQGSLEISTNRTLAGNYTVLVKALSCPGVLEPIPFDRDTGNDWTLEVIAVRSVQPGQV